MDKWLDKKDWDYYQEFKNTFGFRIKENMDNKEKYTRIDYIPSFKGVVVSQYIRPEILVFKESSKLILPHEVSDKDLIAMGLNTKGANVANAGSENQESFIIESIGLKVDQDEFKVGDKVLLRHAAQPIGLEIGGKFYGQIHEYEIAGKLLS